MTVEVQWTYGEWVEKASARTGREGITVLITGDGNMGVHYILLFQFVDL